MNSLRKAVVAETVRIGGIRGSWFSAMLPLGLLAPMAMTFVVAALAERLNHTGGLLQVRAATMDNCLYWLISVGVAVHSVAASYVQARAERGSIGELSRSLIPPPVSGLARWCVIGGVGAAGEFVATAITLGALPALFPTVYREVSLLSPAGLRYLWAVPLWCFIACGIGIGIGALVRIPGVSVAVVALWSLLLEGALIYVPGGSRAVNWMPFLNGVYGTGQFVALDPPWGRDGALLWSLVVAAALVFFGLIRSSRASR